jgi:Nuclear transport factor 2 (NTF2) domain
MSINAQFNQIAAQFTAHYYKQFDSDRSQLTSLYGPSSMMSFESDQFQGAEGIVNKLKSLPFQQVIHKVVTMDAQPNPSNNGVIVMVTGDLYVDGSQNPLKFAQCFHLAPTASGYFVQNDFFRLNYG